MSEAHYPWCPRGDRGELSTSSESPLISISNGSEGHPFNDARGGRGPRVGHRRPAAGNSARRWNHPRSQGVGAVSEALVMTIPTEDEVLAKAKQLAHDDRKLWLWKTEEVERPAFRLSRTHRR